jgi:hypothetical protein
MKNYLQEFAAVPTFQQGGAMPTEAAPAPAQGGGGMEEALAMVVQSQDPAMALEFCNAVAQEAGIGAGPAMTPPMPAEGVPAGGSGMKMPTYKNGGTPVFKLGGELIK